MSAPDAGYGRPRTVRRRRRLAGMTLIELVMYIMIVSIGVSGILSVMTYTTQHSADPMIREQAILIAESYMKEILHKRLIDPAPGVASNICPLPEGAGRAAFDNTCDYNGLNDNSGARDQQGNIISGLTAYNVSVTVTSVGVALGPAASVINNTGEIRVLRVDLVVTHDDDPQLSIPFTGYRTHYTCRNVGDGDCLPL